MDSFSEVQEHGSGAKRLKLDSGVLKDRDLCDGERLQNYSTSTSTSHYGLEGISNDCDSGCGASIMDTTPVPSLQTSPNTDSQDTFSDASRTPVYIGSMNTSQDNADNLEDNVSTISHLSDLSGLSELSGQDWKPMAGSMIWIQKQMQSGVNPRGLLCELGVDSEQIPEHVDDFILWKIIINMLAEPPRRNKLRHVNTLEDIVRLIKGAQNIIVLTGAGVSVSCGIPDFRSKDGIYSRLAVDFPDLPDPQAIFDIGYFSQDPRPFYKFARDIYPGKFTPSPCHRFIKLLEKNNKLLRNYTQNIDTLERIASIEKVIECHGSFATATCTKCAHEVTADEIRNCIISQSIPLCPKCHEGTENLSVPANGLKESDKNYRFLVSSGIMKPDIVFFGEGLPDSFHQAMADDKSKCDLLLVIGSSLKVRPVALIPSSIPPDIPQILINREPLPHCRFDIELLGDCDVIINHLCHMLGNAWEEIMYDKKILRQASLLPLVPQPEDITENSEIEISNNCVIVKNNEPKKNEGTEVNKCNCDPKLTEECNCSNNESIMEGDSKSIKERHASIDSARDSGIGENSNFADMEGKFNENSQDNQFFNSSSDFDTDKGGPSQLDLKGLWQPKIKKSLADRLQPNSFHFIPSSRYIFPGAEVFYDPDEKIYDQEETTNTDSSEYDSDNDSQTN